MLLRPVTAENRVAVSPHATWLADPERRFTFFEVTVAPLADRFSARPSPIRLKPGTGVWSRFHVDRHHARGWLLVLRPPAIGKVCVHLRRSSGIEELCSGWDLPFSSRAWLDPRPVFPLPDDLVEGTVHLYAETSVPIALDLSLIRRESYHQLERSAQWRRGLYYGALGSLMLYNLFLFLSVRDPVYFYYTIHIGGLGMAFFGFEGLGAEYLWPRWPVLWRAPMFFLALAVAGGAFYASRFLNTGKHLRRLDLGLRLAAVLATGGAIITIGEPVTGGRVIAVGIVVFAGCALAATIERWRNGYRPARYLLFAQTLFLAAFPLSALASAELLPAFPAPMSLLRLSVVVGAWLLSFALADRLRQLTAERKSLIPELETRNAELERLSYSLSHDLRTPLHTISTFVGSLERDARAGETSRLLEDLSTVRGAAMKLRGGLDDLLELTRRGMPQGVMESVELTGLVYEVQERLSDEIAAAGVSFEVGKMPVVCADRRRLAEVFTVLIDNVLRHSGKEAPHIEIGALREESMTRIWMRDDGVGIEPRHQGRIFELFEKLDPESPGHGVGLALARRIVEGHGGQIWNEESASSGTVFVWTLPHRLAQ